MRIQMGLKNAAIQIISDDKASEEDLLTALDGQGFVLQRTGSGLRIDTARQCDVGLISVRRSCGWSAGMITALRSSESACAALVVLSAGGPADVAQSLRAGAVDCLVKPTSLPVLLEALAGAVACTRRWRRRISAAAPGSNRIDAVTPTHARVFEPISPPGRRSPPSRRPKIELGLSPGGEVSQGPAADESEERIDHVVRRLAGEKQLTPREREVLYWLLQGHRYEDIAIVLGVAPRTAKFHAANVLRKLDLDSRYDLPRLLVHGT